MTAPISKKETAKAVCACGDPAPQKEIDKLWDKSETQDHIADPDKKVVAYTNHVCPRCKRPYEEHSCYWSPCAGCRDGHSSFWRTVTVSPQWEAWVAENSKRFNHADGPTDDCYDVDESTELGYISSAHFQSFLAFCKTI